MCLIVQKFQKKLSIKLSDWQWSEFTTFKYQKQYWRPNTIVAEFSLLLPSSSGNSLHIVEMMHFSMLRSSSTWCQENLIPHKFWHIIFSYMIGPLGQEEEPASFPAQCGKFLTYCVFHCDHRTQVLQSCGRVAKPPSLIPLPGGICGRTCCSRWSPWKMYEWLSIQHHRTTNERPLLLSTISCCNSNVDLDSRV